LFSHKLAVKRKTGKKKTQKAGHRPTWVHYAITKRTDFEQKQCKKCVALKSLGEKRCKIKGGTKEMTLVVG